MKQDLHVGDRYGDWVVTRPVPRADGDDLKWLCECSCGRVREVLAHNLYLGKSRTCGVGHHTAWNKSHGQNRTPLMGVWRNMISRCMKPGNRNFKNYGGRGISVHPAWLSFEVFSRDVGPHPGNGLTFDRVNNEGNYEPGNVKWASRAEQARNKRSNILVALDGKTQCLQDWALELGVTANHFYRRYRKGMTFIEAVKDIALNPPQVRGPYRTKPQEVTA